VKFQQVFFGLMMLSLLSAFALPRRATDLNGTSLETLLIPISRPTYRIANAIRGRFAAQPIEDTRDSRDIERENLALKQQIQAMAGEIDHLQQRAGERASLGGFEAFCDRFEVTAADSGVHDAITITGSGISGLRVDQPVLSSGSVIALIGQISRAGEMTAQVRLVTDPGFPGFTARFVQYSAANGARENTNLLAIVTGRGEGKMVIDNLAIEDVRNAGIQPGDWVVLSDETWPRDLQGVRIGRIDSIEPLSRQTLFADIRLAPEQNLMHLSDVWVMTHQR
jgi:cell shape-determining protein MreC